MRCYKSLPFFPFLLLLLAIGSSHAQERYKNPISTNIEKHTYTYTDSLQLDFYAIKNDTVTNKPLLVLVHGGGFAIGKRDNLLESNFSRQMAERGYAVAAISYRLTRKGKSFGCDCPSTEKIETFLKASEDILTAARYLTEKAADLKFDTSKIVLVGSSAGAEAVLNTAFMQYQHDFKTLPYADIQFAGVISFAGAALSVDYINKKNAVPTLLFHGEKDKLVPFATAPHHYCKETAQGYLVLNGSQTIADTLRDLNTSYTLVVDPEGNHDWANIPYEQVDLISNFIKESILDGELRQTRVEVNSKK